MAPFGHRGGGAAARTRRSLLPVVLFVVLMLVVSRCEQEAPVWHGGTGPYKPEAPEGPGVAVAILVDTSGSMAEAAPGDRAAKHEVARDAVARMLDATDAFVAKRPDLPVRVALLAFADGATTLRPVAAYDRAAVQAALARLPAPRGGTAIGLALDAARAELYRSGCFRKHVVVVTDGQNTAGPPPEDVARSIHERSGHGVGFHFVAFDTDPARFGFLAGVGGDVTRARDAEELAAVLRDLYEARILAEAADESPAPGGP